MNTALPKVLVGLNGKPLIQHLIDSLRDLVLGYKPIVVVGHKYDLVQSFLGTNFIYAFQEGQFGTAHAVSAAKTKVQAENVIVLYGDMPFIKSESLIQLMDIHTQNNSMFSMFTATVPNFNNQYESHLGFGRIIRDTNGKIKKIQEFVDASPDEREITEVNPGIYMFNTNWLWQNLDTVQKNPHGEYYLTDLVELAISNNVSIATASIDPLEVFGINTPEQLKQAVEILK